MSRRIKSYDGTQVDNRYTKASGLGSDTMPFKRWIRKSILYTDLSADALTAVKTLWTLPAGTVVHDAFLKIITAFTGAATTTVEVGITGGDTDGFIAAGQDVKGAGTGRLYNTITTRGAHLYDGTSKSQFGYDVGTSDVACALKLTNTTDKTNLLTAGKLEVFLLVSFPEDAYTEAV